MNIKTYKKNGETYYKFNAYLGIDPKTGKEKRTNRSGFKSKKEAEIAYLRLLTEVENKIEGKITFEQVYLDWLKTYKKTVSESTLHKITALFNKHILAELGDYYIHTIKLQDIQYCVNKWSDVFKNVKPIKNYTSRVFKFAIQNSYIKENPCEFVIVPKISEKVDKIENFFEKEELLEFLNYAKQDLSHKWYTYLRLLAYTGIRRGEGLALTWDDINFKNKTININKTLTTGTDNKQIIQNTKTNAGTRIINIDDETINVLKKHKINSTSNLVFANKKGEHIYLSSPAKKMKNIEKKYNLKDVSLHGLRHTHCSLLFAAGADLKQVQKRMGHKDIQTTLEIYTHLTKEKSEETNKGV